MESFPPTQQISPYFISQNEHNYKRDWKWEFNSLDATLDEGKDRDGSGTKCERATCQVAVNVGFTCITPSPLIYLGLSTGVKWSSNNRWIWPFILEFPGVFHFLFCFVWLYNEKHLYLTCLKFFYLKSFLACGDGCHNHFVDIFLVCFPSLFNLSVSLGNVNSILLGLRHAHLDYWIGKYHASNAWFQVFTCMNRLPTSYLLFCFVFNLPIFLPFVWLIEFSSLVLWKLYNLVLLSYQVLNLSSSFNT